MQLHVVALTMLAAVFAGIHCQWIPQKVIKFCSSANEYGDDIPAIIITNSSSKFHKSITLCLRINIIEWKYFVHVVESTDFRLFLRGFSDLSGKFDSFGNRSEFQLKNILSVSPSSWNAICLTYDGSKQLFTVTINAEEVLSNVIFNGPDWLNLTDIKLGHAGFNGYITDVNMWSRALSNEEINGFSYKNTSDSFLPDLISWEKGPNIILSKGCPEMATLDANIIESNNAALFRYEFFVFPMISNATEATVMCAKLNGIVYHPYNTEALKWITQRYQLATAFCNNKIWVPFQRSESQPNQWMFSYKEYYNKPAELGLWPINANHSEGDCMYFDVSQGSYFSSLCHDYWNEFCVLCEMERSRLIYRLRSPCENQWHDNRVDNYYVMSQVPGKAEYQLSGEYFRSIIYLPNLDGWQIRTNDFGENQWTAATQIRSKSDRGPLGLDSWKAENCTGWNSTLVHLTNCYIDEFGCPDGECVHISRRCDGAADCIEDFDEMNCTMISFNKNLYHNEQPPLNHRGDKIAITLEITIGNINEVENILHLNIFVHLEWFDWRLTYINLKDGSNILSKEDSKKIWIPKLFFENDLEKTFIKNEELSVVKVRKVATQNTKFNFQLYEHQEYDGRKNPLVFENSYELKLGCELELQYYPFDTQLCFIKFAAALQEQDKIQLVVDNVTFKGPTTLKQFSFAHHKDMEQSDPFRIIVAVYFKRIFSYHLTNTFLPTVSLLLIAEITLFFDESQMELAVEFTLTIMLVMYTMYQSINDSMTKTAYLKMIDVWLLFCLLMPLTIFMLEVFNILQKNRANQRPNQRANPIQGTSTHKHYTCLTPKAVKILVPSASVIFVSGYFFAAWMITTSFDGNKSLASIQ